MAISQWSKTPANNNAAPPFGAPEGMAPSTVNDIMRQMMADIRTWYETALWINYGDTPTYVNATSFTVSGDQTATYVANRRIQATVTAGTVYGYISSSSYNSGTTLTTVNVTLDSGALDSGLSAVALGILSGNDKTARLDLANVFLKPQTLGLPVTTIAGVSGGTTVALTLANAGLVILDCTNGAVTATLPAANALAGVPFEFIRIDSASANAATVQGAGTDTIDGAASVALTGQLSGLSIRGDGASTWRNRGRGNAALPLWTANATAPQHAVARGQVMNSTPPAAVAANGAATSTTVTSGTFTAPSKGLLLIIGYGQSGGTANGGTGIAASLATVTVLANLNYAGQNAFEVASLAMNAGDATTISFNFTISAAAAMDAYVYSIFIPTP